MKYVVDAQLPRRMVQWLTAAGGDAVHTMDLFTGNRTTDTALIAFADQEKRVVVTRDDDFVDTHISLTARQNCCWFQGETSAIQNWKHFSFPSLLPSRRHLKRIPSLSLGA